MYKTSKRLIAMLICLAMVLTMLPMAVFATATTLYVQPNSNWVQADAWFAAYFYVGSASTWAACSDDDGDGVYEVTVPDGDWTNVIFCRMNPASDTLDWSSKWNQTGDLTIPAADDENVCFVVADGWDGMTTSWTTYSADGGTGEVETPEVVYYLRGTMNDWATTDPLTDNGNGIWTITMSLTAGTYSYKVADAAWGSSWGDPNSGDPDGNAILVMTNDADVTFTLDAVNNTLTNDYVSTCTHANTTVVAGSEATCTTAGKTEGAVCADCGATVTEQTEIAALGHTTSTEGETCERCGLVMEMLTVYFENNWKFQSLTGYFWGSAMTTNPEWPGVSMEVYATTEADNDVFVIEVPSDATGLLFKGLDNDYGTDRQTPDITEIVDGTVYYMNYNEELGAEEVLSYDVSALTPACEHEYTYDCDTVCNKCYEETREASHSVIHVEAVNPTCESEGNVEHWYCEYCGTAWLDEAQTMQTNLMSVKLGATHNVAHVEAVEAACHYAGNIEYWYCLDCNIVWADEGQTQVTNHLNVVVSATGSENVVHFEAVEPGCHSNGNVEYWYCADCEGFWTDEACTQVTNSKSVILPATGSDLLVHMDAVEAGCHSNGNVEYWVCYECEMVWTDEALTQVSNIKNVVIPATGSENVAHFEAVEPGCHSNGNVEYWYCADCEGFWTDEACTQVTNSKSVILPATGSDLLVHMEAVEPACHYDGNVEYWICYECEMVWTDEALTQVSNVKNVIIPALGGEVVHVEAVDPTCTELGNIEHWYCDECGQVWQDAALTQLTNRMSVKLGTVDHEYFYACDAYCMYCGELTNPDAAHTIAHVEAKAGTDCQSWDGNVEYWTCSDCGNYWLDEALTMQTNRFGVYCTGEHDYVGNVCTVCGEHANDVMFQTKTEEGVSAIRLLSYVGDLSAYASVTFNVTVDGNTTDLTCTNAYTSLLANGNTVKASDIFGEDAAYFVMYTIDSITEADYDKDMTITVTWTSVDGTETVSESRTVNVGDLVG